MYSVHNPVHVVNLVLRNRYGFVCIKALEICSRNQLEASFKPLCQDPQIILGFKN